jgi:hypothetical protein
MSVTGSTQAIEEEEEVEGVRVESFKGVWKLINERREQRIWTLDHGSFDSHS